ncbi:MAG: hypothetical protein CMK64_11505 [Pseudoalteromonas sp.]|nr:hypothetical protein [Pseudoalteromonas sp.]|tara:strand:- start:1460 stop:2146 length:687 start_codon:yes stop_codon:yes gene_type:complete
MKIRTILLATSLISSSAFASNINFDYVEAGYAKLTLDDAEVSPKGLGLKFSKSVTDNFAVKASYIRTSDEESASYTETYENLPVKVTETGEVTFSQLYAGFGYLWHLDENKVVEMAPYFGKLKVDIDVSTHASANYMGDTINVSGSDSESEDVTLYGLEANYHFAFNDALNMVLGLGYERADYDYEPESNTFYQVQLNYTFAENFTLNFAHRNVKDYKNTGLNIRYNF